MFEARRLLVSFILSVLLHTAILAFPGVRIAPDVTWLGKAEKVGLSVTFVSQTLREKESSQRLTGIAPSRPAQEKPYNSDDSLSEPPSGLRGQDEERPVIELSMDDYLPPSLLDKAPIPLGSVDTDIDFQGMHGMVGDAEIMVLVSSDGRVDGILVMSSSLPGFIVEQATERFAALEFEPGELQGMKVRSRVRIKLAPPSIDELLGNPYSAKQRAWRR